MQTRWTATGPQNWLPRPLALALALPWPDKPLCCVYRPGKCTDSALLQRKPRSTRLGDGKGVLSMPRKTLLLSVGTAVAARPPHLFSCTLSNKVSAGPGDERTPSPKGWPHLTLGLPLGPAVPAFHQQEGSRPRLGALFVSFSRSPTDTPSRGTPGPPEGPRVQCRPWTWSSAAGPQGPSQGSQEATLGHQGRK